MYSGGGVRRPDSMSTTSLANTPAEAPSSPLDTGLSSFSVATAPASISTFSALPGTTRDGEGLLIWAGLVFLAWSSFCPSDAMYGMRMVLDLFSEFICPKLGSMPFSGFPTLLETGVMETDGRSALAARRTPRFTRLALAALSENKEQRMSVKKLTKRNDTCGTSGTYS